MKSFYEKLEFISQQLIEDKITVSDGKILIKNPTPFTAGAVLLGK